MKHIETTCEEETKARSDYKDVEPGEVVADDKLEATVRELLALRHKMDEDALAASRMKAVIMNAMKKKDTLKSKSGVVLATWVLGNESKTVDYKAVFKKYKVKQEDIDANTKIKRASRTFSIEEV
jgi:hypothetical protein